MNLWPLSLREANAFVAKHHRHHKPARGMRFALGAHDGERLVGVAIIGRPVARTYDWREVAEVTRLTTDGTKNVCSFLYAAAARAAKALGHRLIQTYILETELGTSLIASGWHPDGLTNGRQWEHTTERQLRLDGHTRRADQPICNKQRWTRALT